MLIQNPRLLLEGRNQLQVFYLEIKMIFYESTVPNVDTVKIDAPTNAGEEFPLARNEKIKGNYLCSS